MLTEKPRCDTIRENLRFSRKKFIWGIDKFGFIGYNISDESYPLAFVENIVCSPLATKKCTARKYCSLTVGD